jgi:hypothetical protein
MDDAVATIATSTLNTLVVIVVFHHRLGNSPTSVTHTSTKETPEPQITNQDYALLKVSDNEASVELSFSASPNAFAPSAPITLATDTQVERFNENLAKTVQTALSARES